MTKLTGEEAAEIMRIGFARQAQVAADCAAVDAAWRAEMHADVGRAGWVRVVGADDLYRHADHEGDYDLDEAYDLAGTESTP